MAGGGGVIIICTGLGRLLGWVLLWMRRHEFLDVGIRIDKTALLTKCSPLEAALFSSMIEHDVDKWYKIGAHLGITEVHEDQPFPGNLTSPVVAEPYPIPPPPSQ